MLVIVALVVAFLLRTFVVQVFYIPSSSMVPTLAIDDRMVVEKLSYRVREPERGDVVVFRAAEPQRPVERPFPERITRGLGQFVGIVPLDASDLVKRVIGLPGDEISIVDGVLHIEGVPYAESYVEPATIPDFGPVVVPADTLFFLGDNRRNSADSRGSLGFVARDRVVGRAFAVVWPRENLGSLTGLRPEPLTAG
jgi:signal peptidase I